MKRIRLIIKGKVQGVYFRHHTVALAHKLGITGYIRNNIDGSVEVVAEGEEGKLNELAEFCSRGPTGAVVESFERREEEPYGDFVSFGVRY